jgi:hypothetical protein
MEEEASPADSLGYAARRLGDVQFSSLVSIYAAQRRRALSKIPAAYSRWLYQELCAATSARGPLCCQHEQEERRFVIPLSAPLPVA